MPNIGRKYTIEPKPQRASSNHRYQPEKQAAAKPRTDGEKRQGDNPSNGTISGIRLFPGNTLALSRKYGSHRDQMITGIANQNLCFTVTERGLEPEAFVRVQFRCPLGVFVQTVRSEDDSPAKKITPLHKIYQIDREAGQALIIRPRNSADEAAQDIETNGIFVQQWFDVERSKACLQVAATEAWEVIRAEQLSPSNAQGSAPVVLNESSGEFLAAFIKAAEHYLDGEEYDLLKDQAWALIKGTSRN